MLGEQGPTTAVQVGIEAQQGAALDQSGIQVGSSNKFGQFPCGQHYADTIELLVRSGNVIIDGNPKPFSQQTRNLVVWRGSSLARYNPSINGDRIASRENMCFSWLSICLSTLCLAS